MFRVDKSTLGKSRADEILQLWFLTKSRKLRTEPLTVVTGSPPPVVDSDCTSLWRANKGGLYVLVSGVKQG